MDLQQTSQELIDKRDRMKKYIMVGGAALVGLIVAPFVMVAIGGLIGLGVAAAIGFTLIQLAPWFALKMSNLRYRLIETEKTDHIKKVTQAAAQNPIETLTNLLISKNKAFQEFKTSVENAAAARDTFKGKIEKFALKYPSRALEFQKQYERMAALVEQKKKALQEAKQSLDEGNSKLEEMKAYWEMSKDAMELNRAAGMDTGDIWEKLKADTACDAVFESMNTAFAQLEVAAAIDVNSADNTSATMAQLKTSEPVILDVPVKESQKVRN
jgi:hypothetical protein